MPFILTELPLTRSQTNEGFIELFLQSSSSTAYPSHEFGGFLDPIPMYGCV